jgi:hypothetical protein
LPQEQQQLGREAETMRNITNQYQNARRIIADAVLTTMNIVLEAEKTNGPEFQKDEEVLV